MKKTMITDYKATLQEFFMEVVKFLDNRMAFAKDEIEYQKICKAREDIKQIAANPSKYADYAARVADGIEPQVDAFMPNTHDNSAYLILSKVLYHMGNLDSEYEWYRKEAQTALLNARRAIAYRNSKNLFKDIQFLFKSAEKFAVKKEIGR